LCDFGLSKEGIDLPNGTKTFCGTPEYIAPEQLSGDEYTLPVDWWAFGVFLYELVIGLPPFYAKNKQVMYRKILSDDPMFPPQVSEGFQELINGLLRKNPFERYGPPDIRESPFYEGIDFVQLENKAITPPILPAVPNSEATNLFDREFTDQPAQETPTQSRPISTEFENFSFNAAGALNQ
jgi:serum/glucocorticoid-regulated kinase 2